MAARDEVLRFVLQTAGGDAIAALIKQIDALGSAGQASAADVERLVDEFAQAREAESAAADYARITASLAQLGAAADAAGLKLKLATEAEAGAAADLQAKSAALEAAKQALSDYASAADKTAAGERELKQAVRDATAEQRASKSAWTDAANAAKTAGASYERIATEQDQLGAKLAGLRGTLEAAGVSTSDLAAAQATLAKRASDAQSSLQGLAAGLTSEQSAANAAAVAAQKIAEAHKILGTRPFGDVEADIARVRGAYETLAASGTLTAKELAQANAAMATQVSKLRGEADGVGVSLAGIGPKLAAAAASVYGLGRFFAGASKDAAGFEQAMAAVSTLLDDTSGMDHLTESVRGLSAEFGGDLQTNAKALYGILSAGISDSAQALDILRVSNQLALGGLTGIDTAAKAVTATLNAYGLSAAQAGSVSDQFFEAAKAGATSIDELAASIGQVAPVAASVGVGLDQLLAAIATLTNAGLDTAEATTQIKAALTAIVAPGDQAKQTAAGLGIAFDAASLKAKGLSGFIADVTAKAGGSAENLSALFGNVRALQGVLALGGTQARAFADAVGAIDSASGATAEAVDKMAGTAAHRAQEFSASVEQLRAAFGDAINSLAPLLSGLATALDAFNRLDPTVRTVSAGIAAFGLAAGGLAVVARALAGPFTALLPLLTGAGGALRTLASLAGLSAGQLGILAAAATAAGVQVVRAADAIAEWQATQTLLAKTQDELAASQDRLQAKAAQLVTTLRQYADTQVLATSAVAQFSTAQAQSYQSALQNAERYYDAVRVQARAAGDATAQAFATGEVEKYRAALTALADTMKSVADNASSADKAVGLIGATDLLAKLNNLTATGQSTAVALDAVFKDRHFGTLNEPAILGRALGELRGTAADTAAVFQEQLVAALAKLDGMTLASFQQNAVAALAAGKINAADLTDVLNSTLQAALQKLGVSAAAAGASITASGQEMIATFTAVATNAQATAQQIGAAFDAALGGAHTVDEAKALGAALQAAMDAGRIGADAAAQKMAELDDRIRALKADADPLAESFKTLGIKSEAALRATAAAARTAFDAIVQGARDGTAAQEDVRAAFVAYAQAQLAAAANSDATTKAQIEEQLRLQAAALGLTDLLQKAGLAGADAGDKTADSFGRAADSMDRAADAATRLSDSAQGAAHGFDRMASATDSFAANASSASIAVGVLTGKALEAAQAVPTLEGLQHAMAAYKNEVFATVDAYNAFIRKQQEAVEAAKRAAQEIADAQQQLLEAQGDQEGVENLRHQQRLKDLDEEYRVDHTLSKQQYGELVKLEDDLHKQKLANLENEASANADANQRRTGGGSLNRPPAAPEPPPPAPPPAEPPGNVVPFPARPNAAPGISITVQGSIIGGTPAQIAEQLARLIQPQLARLYRLGVT